MFCIPVCSPDESGACVKYGNLNSGQQICRGGLGESRYLFQGTYLLVPQGMSGMDPTHKHLQHHITHASDTGSLTPNSSEIINFSEPLVLNYTV